MYLALITGFRSCRTTLDTLAFPWNMKGAEAGASEPRRQRRQLLVLKKDNLYGLIADFYF